MKKTPGESRALFARMHEWEAEQRRRLARTVRRVTPTRRALEAEKRIRDAARARGERVRWDAAVAELAKTDPKAAAVLGKRIAAMREWQKAKRREEYAALDAEGRRARSKVVEAQRKERLRKEARKAPPVSCACGCGVSWCNLPAPGDARTLASAACKHRLYRRRAKASSSSASSP